MLSVVIVENVARDPKSKFMLSPVYLLATTGKLRGGKGH